MSEYAKVEHFLEHFGKNLRPMGRFVGPPEDGILEPFDSQEELLRYIRALLKQIPVSKDGDAFTCKANRIPEEFPDLHTAVSEGKIDFDPIGTCCVIKAIDQLLGEEIDVEPLTPGHGTDLRGAQEDPGDSGDPENDFGHPV